MDSNASKLDAISNNVAVDTKASPWEFLNFGTEPDYDSDESVEEETEEQDIDVPSADELEYSNDEAATDWRRKRAIEEEDEDFEPTAEINIQLTKELMAEPEFQREEEMEDRNYIFMEDRYDFPKDREFWTEEDLQEVWEEFGSSPNTGWDPVWSTDKDWEAVRAEVKKGRSPPIGPFYVPYYPAFPVIADEIYDFSTPKSVIEELDRLEEFLSWVSFIFKDGSSYEGTVWDDLAHGKGVYVARQGLIRYEGEWVRNIMDGHGVLEVDIPDTQPRPGSKLEDKMRAKGKIIKRDFMSPDDQKWLRMDIEDSIRLRAQNSTVPFYLNNAWIKMFGKKPEKGRYKYAGQWKHGRMHGCGVYEVNQQMLYGRFYFGEYINDISGCDADISALHAGIAEVAAAKARMFVNKPDGMVREQRGSYGDPQHPYFYEEEDTWMAPGFINQFHEIPDYWKTYVEEVDQEREMWLNSFYKAPLRIPMPAELEYWWQTEEIPEFVLINKEPEPDPEDPSKLIYTEDPLILHTVTGRLINYVDDEKYGIRLFWMPTSEFEYDDDDIDSVEFLPLGFNEFYGRAKQDARKKDNRLASLFTSFGNAIKWKLKQLEKWVDEKKKASELNLKLINHELDLVEAQICLEEEIEEFESELKRKQKEEEKRASQMDLDESSLSSVREADSEEEEDDGEETASSFGIASSKNSEIGSSKDDEKGRQSRTPFSSLSMSFSAFASATQVPKKFLGSFLPKDKGSRPPAVRLSSSYAGTFRAGHTANASSISYPRKLGWNASLRIVRSNCHKPYTPMQNGLDCPVSAGGTASKISKAKYPRNDSWHAGHGIREVSDLERHPLCVLSLHVSLGSHQIS